MSAHQQRLGLLFILVGPTGAGKNTLINGVLERLDALQQLPTATSRPIRPEEQEGREHHFVTREEFERMIEAAELLEWQNVHGNLYGVPKGTVEHLVANRLDRIADIDVLGGLRVRSLYPDNVVLVFVSPGSDDEVLDIVRQRLEMRGDAAEDIATRLRRVEMEMKFAVHCDYIITNDDADDATDTLESIIRAEYSRRDLANLRVSRNQPRRALVYRAAAIITQGDDVLCHDNALPNAQILDGELPSEAAMRAVAEVFYTPAEQRPPKMIDFTVVGQPRYQQATYWYALAGEISPNLPDGWDWQPLSSAVPDEIYQQLGSITAPSRQTVGK